jgi:hypothetical protein
LLGIATAGTSTGRCTGWRRWAAAPPRCSERVQTGSLHLYAFLGLAGSPARSPGACAMSDALILNLVLFLPALAATALIWVPESSAAGRDRAASPFWTMVREPSRLPTTWL